MSNDVNSQTEKAQTGGTGQIEQRKQVNSEIPEIMVGDRPFRETIEEAQQALKQANELKPQIFRRRNKLVRISADETGAEIAKVDSRFLRSFMGRAADFFKVNSKGRVHVPPPGDVLGVMQSDVDPEIPILEDTATVPILTPDRELLYTGGYHPRQRLFLQLDSLKGMKPVPVEPTEQDVKEALSLICDDLLIDFRFQNQSDLANTVGMLLHPILRRSFVGSTPFFLISAPVNKAAKTLLAQTVGVIVSGRPTEISSFPGSESERRKTATAALDSGTPVIIFDNVNGDQILDSDVLAGVTTGDRWADRRLGHTERLNLRNLSLWILTSVQPNVSYQLWRRRIPVRLKSPVSKSVYGTETYRHPRLLEWALENRSRIIRALLILVQSWISAGRPEYKGHTIQSFEGWSETLGGILHHAGLRGFLRNVRTLEDLVESPEREQILFLEAWWERFGGENVRVEKLLPLCLKLNLLEGVRKAKGRYGAETKIGWQLRKLRGKEMDGLAVKLAKDLRHRGKIYCLVGNERRQEEKRRQMEKGRAVDDPRTGVLGASQGSFR